MDRTIKRSIAFFVFVIALFAFAASAYAACSYTHDPMQNPKAAADIIVDPDAVYGYAPNPDSVRLGAFAKYDWSDAAFVAQMKQEREAYHESIHELYQTKADMEAQGNLWKRSPVRSATAAMRCGSKPTRTIPTGLATLKESNLQKYGNENGGTPEYYYEKTGSWEAVIEKAFSTNAGADAMLGLYDKYYDTYYIIDDSDPKPESGSGRNLTGSHRSHRCSARREHIRSGGESDGQSVKNISANRGSRDRCDDDHDDGGRRRIHLFHQAVIP